MWCAELKAIAQKSESNMLSIAIQKTSTLAFSWYRLIEDAPLALQIAAANCFINKNLRITQQLCSQKISKVSPSSSSSSSSIENNPWEELFRTLLYSWLFLEGFVVLIFLPKSWLLSSLTPENLRFPNIVRIFCDISNFNVIWNASNNPNMLISREWGLIPLYTEAIYWFYDR